VVEYVDSKKPIAVVDFDGLSSIRLRVTGSSFSDSTLVRLDVWLDLQYRDGRKTKWRSASFSQRYRTIQAFIEAYAAYQVIRNGGLGPALTLYRRHPSMCDKTEGCPHKRSPMMSAYLTVGVERVPGSPNRRGSIAGRQ
jgi:hypothetical protein